MLKLFFKSMWYGIRDFFEAIWPPFLLCAVPMVSCLVASLVTNLIILLFPNIPKELLVIPFILIFILGIMLFFIFIHYREALKFVKEHKVSFEEAWEATRGDDDDGMY